MCIGLEVQTLKVSEMSEMENGVRSPRENGGRSPREEELDGSRGDENLGHRDHDFESPNGDMVTVPRDLLNKILKNTEENKKKAREAEIRARVSQIKQAVSQEESGKVRANRDFINRLLLFLTFPDFPFA